MEEGNASAADFNGAGMEEKEHWGGVTEFLGICSLSRKFVYDACKEDKIPHCRAGKKILIPFKEALRALRSGALK